VSDQQASLGEQALNKVAEVGIASQLRAVDELAVSIKTDPLKLLGGEVEAVTVEGEGLVMQKELRVERMEIETGPIAINPLAAAFGKIELTRPTEAIARIDLSEADINRSFNSEFIRGRMQGIRAEVDGQIQTVDVRSVDFRLPGDDRVAMRSLVFVHESGQQQEVCFTAVLRKSDDGSRILFEQVRYEGAGLSEALTEALVAKASDLATISNFELDGMSLRLTELEVEPGRLALVTELYAVKFPEERRFE
jgi:hypothetical protein